MDYLKVVLSMFGTSYIIDSIQDFVWNELSDTTKYYLK